VAKRSTQVGTNESTPTNAGKNTEKSKESEAIIQTEQRKTDKRNIPKTSDINEGKLEEGRRAIERVGVTRDLSSEIYRKNKQRIQ
jgi:hypothetical protein